MTIYGGTTVIEDTKFSAGDQVQINNPYAPPGWNVVGTVQRFVSHVLGRNYYEVSPNSGQFAGIPGGFEEDFLSLVVQDEDPTDIGGFSVGDRVSVATERFAGQDSTSGIRAGETGTVTGLKETDYSAYVLVTLDRAAVGDFPFTADELAHVEEHVFQAGDRVLVAADATTGNGGPVYFGSVEVEAVVINGEDDEDGDVLVRGPGTIGSLIQYVGTEHLTPLAPETVPDSELVGALVGGIDALNGLPDGTIVRTIDGRHVRTKIGGNWFNAGEVQTYNFATELCASIEDLLVVYVPQT